MKRSIIFFLFISGPLFSQEFKFPKHCSSVSVGIPGTQTMIDQFEVSVSDWFAFVYSEYYTDDAGQLEAGFETVMPDTTKMPSKYLTAVRMFRRLQTYQDNADLFYLAGYRGKTTWQKFEIPWLYTEKMKHKPGMPLDSLEEAEKLDRMLDLPVVGISFAQVQLYLAWREKLANEYAEVKKTGYKVRARLMRPDEWTKIANNIGPRYKTNNTAQIDTVNEKGCYLVNVRVMHPCPSYEKGVRMYGPGAVTVAGYFPDRYGLYSIFGNAWEMTSEEGAAMGGGWNNFASFCNVTKTLSYSGPEAYLGFRCVLEFYK